MSNKTNTPELIAAEPPQPRSGGGVGQSPIGLWLTALRDRPGVWHEFPEPQSPAISANISGAKAYGTSPGEFEAVIRGVVNRRGTLYARYVGGES